MKQPFKPETYYLNTTLPGLVSRLEKRVLPHLLQSLTDSQTNALALDAARFVGDVRVGAFMLTALTKKKARPFALDWISRHRDHALFVGEAQREAKKAKVKNAALEMLTLAQEEVDAPYLSLSSIELETRAAPAESKAFATFDLGIDTLELKFDETLKVVYAREDKVTQKFPRVSKDNNPALVKEIKKLKKNVEKSFDEEQRARVIKSFLFLLKGGDSLSPKAFESLCAHPLTRSLVSRFVWNDGEHFMSDERMPTSEVRMAHPLEMSADEVLTWQQKTHEIALPFEQFDRELSENELVLPAIDAEFETLLSAHGFWRVFDDEGFAFRSAFAPMIRLDVKKSRVDFAKASPRARAECLADLNRLIEKYGGSKTN